MKITKVLNERGYPVGYYDGMGWKLTKGRYFIFVDGDITKKMFVGRSIHMVPIGVIKAGYEYAVFVDVPGVVEHTFVIGDIEDYMEVIDVDFKNKSGVSRSRRTSKKKASAGDNKGN